MTPVTTFSGLATGMDTGRIVEQLVQLERRPITMLQRQQSDLSSMSKRLSDLSSKLKGMQEAAQDLDGRTEVLASKATSSDEDAVVATADGGASLGSFSVSVASLAKAERTYSDAFAADDQSGLFGTGTLSIQVGSETAVDVDVTASDTLESVVSKINGSGADVTAGLLFDGTNYRLQVTGNNTGADNAITFTETGTSFGLDDAANQVQAAVDANFEVDGFTMTRGTNTVSDAIPGVTLDLLGQTSGDTTVTITRDSEALEENVGKFVDAYNAVNSFINKEFAFVGQARFGDSLSGDSTLRGLQSRLRTEVGQTISGLDAPYNRLAGVGIEVDSTGKMELDSTALSDALGEDPEAVAKLFMDDPETGVNGFMSRFSDLVDEYTKSGSGLLKLKMDAFDDRKDGIDDQIDRMELRIEDYEERLRSQFTQMEQLVSGLQTQQSQMMAMMGQLV